MRKSDSSRNKIGLCMESVIMKTMRNFERGQGLVEYALVITLVSLVAIVVTVLIGLAATHNYGILAGVFGIRKDIKTGSNYIYFDNNPPQCGFNGANKLLYMQFFTDIEPYLTATTENANI